LRQGVVTDINSGRTIDLTIGGVELTGVPCLTSAVPRVGSAVMVVVSGRDMFVLGSVADDTSHGYTPMAQHGHLVIANTGASTFDTVTFDWEFPDVPDVVATCSRGHTSNKPYIVTIRRDNITTAEVPIRVSSFDGSSNSEDVDVHWYAFQKGE
jgi:hypothetical protein